SQSRILLSASPDKASALEAHLRGLEVPVTVLGKVEGSQLTVEVNGQPALNEAVASLKQIWEDVIPCLMK
ncbi:hypothetical protein E4V51_16740, partial [Paenibacillus sp. 28ISP30-2]|nr:hypothetical protein [Paenibacillus sp. 28ISP30-2]